MKKVLLSAAALLVGGPLMAQSYFSDDFTGGMSAWTLIDSDGDGYDWDMKNYNDGVQDEHASSDSWNSTDGPLTPDNWMISPAVVIPGGAGTVHFTWKVYAQDQSWADENYTAYVATGNQIADFTASATSFTEVVGTSAGYEGRSIDVSAYAGQTIYVAFRHHNVTDMFRLNIDDVNVKTVANDDAACSIARDKWLAGNRSVDITIDNVGANTITSADVSWEFNAGGVQVDNLTGLSIAPGSSYVHTVNITAPEGTAMDFDATVTTVNGNSDPNTADNNDNASWNFYPMVPNYVHSDSYGNPFDLHTTLASGQAVIFDFMASWCGPCQSSTPELETLYQNNGAGQTNLDVIAVTVESTDDNAVMNGLTWGGTYPKFSYITDNDFQFFHYGSSMGHDLQGGGSSIPFFVMLCPNPSDPKNSSVVAYDIGYAAGFTNAYQTALNNCATATASVEEEVLSGVAVYPNPLSSTTTVDFTVEGSQDVTIEMINVAGQTVYTNALGTVSGHNTVTIDASDLDAGIYMMNIVSEGGIATERLVIQK